LSKGHDILHGILGRVALFFLMAREGHCFSRGFTTILVALPPLNNDNSLIQHKQSDHTCVHLSCYHKTTQEAQALFFLELRSTYHNFIRFSKLYVSPSDG
jgi:hypothetical protein